MERTNNEILEILKHLTDACNKKVDRDLLNKIDYTYEHNYLIVSLTYINNKLHFLFFKDLGQKNITRTIVDVNDNFFDKYLNVNMTILTLKKWNDLGYSIYKNAKVVGFDKGEPLFSIHQVYKRVQIQHEPKHTISVNSNSISSKTDESYEQEFRTSDNGIYKRCC